MSYQEYKDYERLGDAVLRLIIIDMFVFESKNRPRGYFNVRISKMQTNVYMNRIAPKLGCVPHELDTSPIRFANALESHIGVTFKKSGLKGANELVRKYNKLFFDEFE